VLAANIFINCFIRLTEQLLPEMEHRQYTLIKGISNKGSKHKEKYGKGKDREGTLGVCEKPGKRTFKFEALRTNFSSITGLPLTGSCSAWHTPAWPKLYSKKENS
jgi:hypothetical protein